MDAKSIGYMISALRRRCGWTQSQLAARLSVSDKTVSKWENGIGYPEITQFPALSALFGVSVDYIMTGERKGIALAGNILADLVKTVDYFPALGMLAHITGVTRAVGGCVPNVGIDLAKIDRSIPISALGKIGDDEYGRFVLSRLQKYGIDTGRISISAGTPTSFSDVISLPTGERTFFHAKGANAEFSPEDVDISSLNCRILHIGYLLLLDSFDQKDEEYGTVMARFLHEVQQRGIRTCIDLVSDSSADYVGIVQPVLPWCDYVIINEIECCAVWGLSPCDSQGRPDEKNIRLAMENMVRGGVKEKVIVHCKTCGFCLNAVTGQFSKVMSLKIPAKEIKGSVGAGDAFCAGCLYGLYSDYTDEELLQFASAAAASNLFCDNSVDGMLPKEELLRLPEKYGRLPLTNGLR